MRIYHPHRRHPHSRKSTPLNSNPTPNRASEPPVSDFARDFYAADGGNASESQPQTRRKLSNLLSKNKGFANGDQILGKISPTQVTHTFAIVFETVGLSGRFRV